MLTLVRGADRTILSHHAMEYVKESAKCGETQWILMVPEQFSFEAERNWCKTCGTAAARFAEVLSFSRLADRIASIEGGIAGAYLDKGGQMLTMALAAEQVVSRIKLYAAVLKKPEFLADMLRVIEEFRSYCIDPSDLMEASKRAKGQFAQKLEELGILYEAYLAVCANGKADPTDKLLRLRDRIPQCEWIRGKSFYIDGFSDYTTVEEQVVESLIIYAKDVLVGLPEGMSGSVMHQSAEKTVRRLQKIAQRNMIDCVQQRPELQSRRHADVQRLLSHMFSYDEGDEYETDAVKMAMFSSVEEESRAAVMEAKRLVKKGARYRDICVACTDVSKYEVPLRNAFQAAGISAYFAGERSLLSKPVIVSVVNSLYAASGAMEYEDVSLYLKSGLAPADRACCDRLDKYAYLWNLRGSGWASEWNMHPRGFGEEFKEEDRALLAQLNAEKTSALTPLLRLRRNLSDAGNTADMVLALYGFLEDVSLRELLEEQANRNAEQGCGQKAQELAQIYEILVGSLEQMWLTLGQTERSADDFCRLYHTIISQYQVATVPFGLDQIQISDLPDLRNRTVPHLIVLGAGDGSFPSYKSDDGILSEDERTYLTNQGLQVAPGRADRMDQELGKIYFALCAAKDSLWLSCCSEQPSWLLRRAISLYPGSMQKGREDQVLNLSELAAWRLHTGDRSETSDEELKQLEDKFERCCQYTFEPLREQTVQGLYGSPISLSPSKIDKFAACRFAFFMNYGLKAKPWKQAKLDQPAFGTFVHAVLEHTVLRVKELGGFRAVNEEQILDIATREINRYAERYFPEQAVREEYLFNRSKAEIRDIVLDLWEELRRSKFSPEYCELKFAADAELPPVKIDGVKAQARVIGTVDRVDLYHEGEKIYVRVVDYKTGSKDFDYTDILNGAGLQMLIYLFALRTAGDQRLEPAGVLYLPAKKEYPLTEPMPDDETVLLQHRDKRKRKGLIRGDDNLLAAMEEDPEAPLFMPYKCSKRGISGNLATKEQMELLERYVVRTLSAMTDEIAGGDVGPDPIIRGQMSSCSYCDYQTVCHKDLDTQNRRVMSETSAAKFWEELERREEADG